LNAGARAWRETRACRILRTDPRIKQAGSWYSPLRAWASDAVRSVVSARPSQLFQLAVLHDKGQFAEAV
jgi:hypothetical protein